MRTVSTIARYLAGAIFLVFGLNGFLNFIPLPPPGSIAGLRLPTISVPCGLTTSGLPIGLQIAGAPFAESTVLALDAPTNWKQSGICAGLRFESLGPRVDSPHLPLVRRITSSKKFITSVTWL